MRSLFILIAIVFLPVFITLAQTPAEGPGGKVPKPKGVPADVLIKILSASQVQEEIGLSDEQIASIRQRGTEIQQELETLLRQRVSSAVEELLSPEQYARLKQISYRATGANAFQDPDVVSRLNLTPKQQQDIKNIYESMAVELEDVKHFFKGKEGEEIRFIMEEEVRTVTKSRVMKILDDGQRRLYEQLLGKEFDTSTIHLGGGPPPKAGPKGPPPRK